MGRFHDLIGLASKGSKVGKITASPLGNDMLNHMCDRSLLAIESPHCLVSDVQRRMIEYAGDGPEFCTTMVPSSFQEGRAGGHFAPMHDQQKTLAPTLRREG